jgi:hypothetical protein
MPRVVLWIWRVFAIHFAIGMIAYAHFLITGSYRYITLYFLILGTLFFLMATAAEFFLAFECRAGFEPDEPMRMAWTFIGLAAASRFAGTVLVFLNHWHLSLISGSAASVLAAAFPGGLAQMGAVLGGPLSMIFLAVALSRVLKVQRLFGILRGLTRTDLLLLGLIFVFTIAELVYIAQFVGPRYRSPSLAKAILWLSDPLLTLLLVQAVLIRRSVIRVGLGLISQCWEMFVLAIVTTLAGDASLWVVNEGLLSASFVALTWYIWFFAAAAFASAPAYQLAAMALPLVHEGVPSSNGE